jgi:O-antigen/teichoic acid export membrane protein
MGDTTLADGNADQQNSAGKHSKFKKYATFLAKFLSLQLVVQVLGLACGVLIARTLSHREYAYFTLANTMQATLMMLADIGIGNAVFAIGGKVWENFERFGEVVQTGMTIRRSLFWISSAVAISILAFLLHQKGANWWYIIILSGAVLLGCWFRMTNDLWQIVPNIRGQINRLQKLDLYNAIGRLIALGLACLALFKAVTAILIGSVGFAFQSFYLRRWAAEGANLNAPTNSNDRKEMLSIIKRQAPSSIYYCVQGQLSVFLISMFGTTRSLAELGALGRISILFSVVSTLLGRVVLPRFARTHDKKQLKAIFTQIVGCYFVFEFVLLALAYFFPEPFIWILGKKYAFAVNDFVWVVLGAVIWNFVAAIYATISIRAWTMQIWTAIPLVVLTQFILAHFVDLGTVKGVTIVTAMSELVALIPYFRAAKIGFKSVGEIERAEDESLHISSSL